MFNNASFYSSYFSDDYWQQLGPQGDVTISRKGKRKLEIDAMVTTESLALPAGANMMIGGVLLEDYIKQLARKIIAASPPPKPAGSQPERAENHA